MREGDLALGYQQLQDTQTQKMIQDNYFSSTSTVSPEFLLNP